MKKRLISLVLAIAMVASTFPANALAEEVESEQDPVPAVTETVPEEPTPEPEPEPATEPPAEAATEPETEPVTEPATEPETEPETEPATEPVTEPAAVTATVTFICTPGELTLTVFPADANEQSAIKPQADGSYLLLPGDYVYLAAAEGYESARGRFTLPEQTPTLTVEVTLTQSAPEQETEAPTEEATEAPTEEPTEAPTEAPTEEATAPVPSAIPVSFACTPAELTLVVFPADADETAAVDPQENGTYLLLPGDYAYLAAAEGYEPLEGFFTVPAEAEDFQVAVVLSVSATEEEAMQLDEGILDSGTCGENLTWTLSEDGVLTISGTGDMEDFSWSSYTPWYKYRAQIVSISIEAGVSSIGENAFENCSSLAEITISQSITRIGNSVFKDCSALANVIIPESVTSIGYYAFSGCSSLTDIKIPDSVTSIGSYAFDGCSSLTSVRIPDSVTKLDEFVFNNCSSLVSVTLPLSITGIDRMTFNNCSKLSTIFIPRSVTNIGYFAFWECNSLSVIYYGGSETEWKNISIDSSNHSLSDVVIHYDATHICTLNPVAEQVPTATQDGNHAYWLCSICQQAYKDAGGIAQTTVEAETIPAGTIAYGSCGKYLSWTLYGSGELVIYGSGSMTNYSQGSVAPWNRYRKDIVSITVTDGVTSIGDYAFYSCYRLNRVSIAPSVTKIGQNAFDSCTKLVDVVLPEGVTTISRSAFTGCTGLQSIVIPESVTSIESAAFYNCSNLTGVTIPKDVTAINGLTFYGCCSLTHVSIPEGVTSIGNSVFHGCSKLEEINLPETLTWIDGNVFYNCTSLTNVVIPENATDIAGGTFMGCTGLTSVVLPSEIAYIPRSIFSGCTSLTKVTIPDSVVKIDYSAFEGCTSLTTIVVPEGVTTIESEAFQNCRSLTGLLIPESLTYIGAEAFLGCTGLNVVYYAGEKADWDNIQIGESNSSLTGSVIRCNATHICTLTEIPAKAPTYTEDGNNQYWVCSVCQQAYQDAWGKVETTVEAETIPGKPCIAAGTCGQRIDWVLTEDGVMILSGSGEMESFAASGDAPWDAHRARITAIVIPAEITAIGSNAFDSCENLTTVCYAGTAEQWTNVQIGSGNASLNGAPVRYNTDHMCLLTEVPAKEPTYIEDGHNTYWVCAICQKLYKDAQGTEETTAEAEAIPKLPSVAAGTCGENIIWALGEDGVMDVFGTGAMASYSSSDDVPWRDVRDQIRSVVIAEGVTGVDSFLLCYNLESVTLPSSLKTIGHAAFLNCSKLVSVAIPDGVTNIGSQAFESCGLTRVFIPKSVTQIGSWVFGDCRNLTDIYYFGSETDWAKIQIGSSNSGLLNATIHYDFTHVCTLTKVDAKPATETEDGCREYWVCPTCGLAYKDELGKEKTTMEAESIPAGTIAFGNCGDLGNAESLIWIISGSGELTISGTGWMPSYGEEYDTSNAPWYEYREYILSATIGDGIVNIGTYAFYGCSNLTSVQIPNSVIYIFNKAFSGCSSLTSIFIPESVTSIDYAFVDCSSLVNVNIPSKVTSIVGTFMGCTSLVNVNIPEAVTRIESAFDGCTSLTTIEIPDGVTNINNAFMGCSNLTSVNIPKSVTAIGWSAFSGCSSLTSIDIPEHIASIKGGAFRGCSSLTNIALPQSITNIEYETFSGCSSLASIDIPTSVTSIEWSAFSECSSLTSINVPESVTSIGEAAFAGCSNLTSVNIPAGVMSIAGVFVGCSSLTDIKIPDGVTDITSAFSGCTSLASVEIPDSVTSIGASAFSDCTSLTSLVIPNSVTSIEESAFSGSGLISFTIPGSINTLANGLFQNCTELVNVTIPEGVTRIGERTFENCRSLVSLTIPETVTSIGNYAFANCGSLTDIAIPQGVTKIGTYTFSFCTQLSNVVLSDNITSIGTRAFDFCNQLTTVTIPQSVTSIGRYAFNGCRRLATVFYKGTEADWNSIRIDAGNLPLTGAEIRYISNHICELTEVPAKASTCTEEGNNRYWICSVCGKVYKDALGKVETTIEAETLPTKPAATTMAKVTGSEGSFTAAWKTQKNINGYAVQYATNSSFATCRTLMVYGARTTSKTLNGLAAGTYYVRVRTFKTVDGKKIYSLASPALTVTVGSTKPTATTLTKVTAVDGGFTAAWNAQTNADGYAVQYAADSSFASCKTVMVYGGDVASATVKNLAAGTYYVRVRTFKAAGNSKAYSLASAAMAVTVGSTKPATTTLTKVTAGDGSFTAAWNAQTNADGYAVQYAANSSFASCKTVMVYGGDVASATVKNLAAGTYYVRVRTFKATGNSKTYSLASTAMTVTVGSTKPTATTLTKVTAGDGGFTAAWNAQTNADGYALQYATNSSFASCKTVMVYGGDVASTTVKNLTAGTYYVRVRTFKTAGNRKAYSLASAAMAVTVGSTKPATTTLTKVTAGDGSFTAAWNAQTNADGYAVQYAADSSFASCKTVMVYGGSTTSRTVKDLTAGTYYVRVRTFKTVENSKTYSLASTAMTVKVASAKPVTTTLTKVTAGDGSFTAAWNAQQNVDGYAVQYATNSSFASCKTVMVYGASATSKAVKDLPAGTYYVRVRTFKTVDGAKNYSLASAYLTVTVK